MNPVERPHEGEPSLEVAIHEDDDVLVLDEFVLPVWEPTGQPQVDAALERIAALDTDDLSTHAPVFDDVHRQLRQVLADLDG